MNKADLIDRLVFPMINEAVRCFDEAVAGNPGPQAAGQIDLASVMGMGFPACYGGLMHYAESLGAKKVLERLQTFEKKFGERYSPALGIVKRAQEDISFYQAT